MSQTHLAESPETQRSKGFARDARTFIEQLSRIFGLVFQAVAVLNPQAVPGALDPRPQLKLKGLCLRAEGFRNKGPSVSEFISPQKFRLSVL